MNSYRSVAVLIVASTLVSQSRAYAQAPAAAPAAAPEATEPPTEPGARCVYYHMEAQRERRAKKLIEAKAAMRQCAMSECPTMVQQDCLQWMQSIDEQTPSVVFSVEADGKPVTGAKITVDDQEIDASTASAIPLNPGLHRYVVSNPPYESQSGSVNVLEGQRYRVVNVRLEPPKPAVGPRPVEPVAVRTETVRPIPLGTWVLLGVGVVGAGAFAGMGLTGKSQESELKEVCSPNCTDYDTKSMRTLYLGADIAAGVGAAALIAAGVVFITRPSYERQVAVSVAPLPGGVQAAVTWSRF
jgi:hypothetical protein